MRKLIRILQKISDFITEMAHAQNIAYLSKEEGEQYRVWADKQRTEREARRTTSGRIQ